MLSVSTDRIGKFNLQRFNIEAGQREEGSSQDARAAVEGTGLPSTENVGSQRQAGSSQKADRPAERSDVALGRAKTTVVAARTHQIDNIYYVK